MSTLTIRMAEEKHARRRRLAAAQGVSMIRLMDELATIALARNVSVAKGLRTLDKLANTPGRRRGGNCSLDYRRAIGRGFCAIACREWSFQRRRLWR